MIDEYSGLVASNGIDPDARALRCLVLNWMRINGWNRISHSDSLSGGSLYGGCFLSGVASGVADELVNAQ